MLLEFFSWITRRSARGMLHCGAVANAVPYSATAVRRALRVSGGSRHFLPWPMSFRTSPVALCMGRRRGIALLVVLCCLVVHHSKVAGSAVPQTDPSSAATTTPNTDLDPTAALDSSVCNADQEHQEQGQPAQQQQPQPDKPAQQQPDKPEQATPKTPTVQQPELEAAPAPETAPPAASPGMCTDYPKPGSWHYFM